MNKIKPVSYTHLDVYKRQMFEEFALRLSKTTKVVTGVFGADMKINLLNDGPVTLILKSEDL